MSTVAIRLASGLRPLMPRSWSGASRRCPDSAPPRHASWSASSPSISAPAPTAGSASLRIGPPSRTCEPLPSARRTRRRSAHSSRRCARRRQRNLPRRPRRSSGRRNRWVVAGAEVNVFEDGGIRIVKIGPMGPYGNNAYVVRDVAAGEALLVDMPLDESPLLEAIAAEGAEGAVGSVRITVLHTPGHTPGSISLRVGRAVISGDTLFDGGPGKTAARGDLETIVASIAAKLLPLPEETLVMPGHGANTTISDSRRGHAAHTRPPKPAGFFGDVTWGD